MNRTASTESNDIEDIGVIDSYGLLDTLPEKEYDAITTLASSICLCPVSLILLEDRDRHFIKSSYGLDLEEVQKANSSCIKHLSVSDSPMVINDTKNSGFQRGPKFEELDSRFLFIAGVPLISPSGYALGTLCVMDYQPSRLSEEQLHSMELLAGQVIALMESRKKQLVLKESYQMMKDADTLRRLDRINNEALINNTSDDIWSIDRDYKLIAFNQAFSKKMEYLTGKKIGSGSPALYPGEIPEDMHRQFKAYFDRALSGESFVEEYCRPERLKEGMLIWIELNGHPIYQEGKINGAAFFARTITERKEAEIKTKESEANYRMLFEHSPLPKFLLALDTMRIIEANQSAISLYGYEKSEMVGSNMDLLLDKTGVVKFQDSIDGLIEKEVRIEPVIHLKKPNGFIQGEMMVHKLVYQGRNCVLVMINDQSEKLRADSRKSQLADILENSLNEIYIFDINELKFLYVNRGAKLNMGYTLDEIRQLTPIDIKPDFNETQFRDFIQPLIKEEKERLVFMTVHERKDGSRYPVEVHLQKMWYEGQPAFVAIIIDITEAKKAQKKLNELNLLLEKSNHELEQFAAITAHDLQEPLRMVSGFTSLLKKKYESHLDEKGLQYIHYATDGALRMQQMIKDILEYSKAGGVQKKLEQQELTQILSLVTTDLHRRIQITGAKIQFPEETVHLYGNKHALYRLFLNLINNALKFIPKDRKPEINILLREDTHQYHFIVKDNGIGIAPEHLPKLFKPFTRLHTKEEFEGTGLGLATCKKIVNFHNGEIWATSDPGSGSQFHFTLPKIRVI